MVNASNRTPKDHIPQNNVNFLGLCLKIFNVLGLVPSHEIASNSWKHLLYRIYQALTMSLVVSEHTAMLVHAIQNFEDIDEGKGGTLVAVGFLTIDAETLYILLKWNSMQKIIDLIQSDTSDFQQSYIEYLLKGKKISVNIIRGMMLCVCIGYSLWVSHPVLLIQASEEKLFLLPFATWLPFEITTTCQHVTVYLLQMIGHLYAMCYWLCGIAIFAALGTYSSSRLKILNSAILDINSLIVQHSHLRSAVSSVVTFTHETSGSLSAKEVESRRHRLIRKKFENLVYMAPRNPESDRRNRDGGFEAIEDHLVKCIKEHQKISNLVDMVNDAMSLWCHVHVLHAMILMLFTLVVATRDLSNVTDVVTGCITSGFTMADIFVICYCGETVIQEDNAVQDSVYICCWYDCSPRFKRLLSIIIARCQKPISLKLWKFGTLSLQTFSQVMNASYSYLALLQEMRKMEAA